MIDQGIEHIRIFINMSTYVVQLDSHQDHECANVFEASVYLQHDMRVLMMNQHELNVMEDWDENRQFEVELKTKLVSDEK